MKKKLLFNHEYLFKIAANKLLLQLQGLHQGKLEMATRKFLYLWEVATCSKRAGNNKHGSKQE